MLRGVPPNPDSVLDSQYGRPLESTRARTSPSMARRMMKLDPLMYCDGTRYSRAVIFGAEPAALTVLEMVSAELPSTSAVVMPQFRMPTGVRLAPVPAMKPSSSTSAMFSAPFAASIESMLPAASANQSLDSFVATRTFLTPISNCWNPGSVSEKAGTSTDQVPTNPELYSEPDVACGAIAGQMTRSREVLTIRQTRRMTPTIAVLARISAWISAGTRKPPSAAVPSDKAFCSGPVSRPSAISGERALAQCRRNLT